MAECMIEREVREIVVKHLHYINRRKRIFRIWIAISAVSLCVMLFPFVFGGGELDRW